MAGVNRLTFEELEERTKEEHPVTVIAFPDGDVTFHNYLLLSAERQEAVEAKLREVRDGDDNDDVSMSDMLTYMVDLLALVVMSKTEQERLRKNLTSVAQAKTLMNLHFNMNEGKA